MVFFFFFELGLRLVWILFWFGLELSGDKDQKCVKRHTGILGEALSKFPQNMCFCFSHNLTYRPPIWMIPVENETKEPELQMSRRDRDLNLALKTL